MTPKSLIHKQLPGCYDREHMVVGLQLPVQSVLITTKVMSSNLVHYEMYSIQHYMVKFVKDLRPVGGVLLVFSTNKTDHHDIAEILLKVVLNTINEPN